MRKIMLILIIICLLLGITTSFAEDRNTHRPRDRSEGIEKQIKDRNKIGMRRELKNSIAPLIKEVDENRKKSYDLKQKSKESYKNAKTHVRKLMKEKDSLTDEQMVELKESLENLRSWNKKMVGTRGDIVKTTKELRNAKEKKNYKTIKENYEKIIEIQNSRIEKLNKVIENFNNIAEI